MSLPRHLPPAGRRPRLNSEPSMAIHPPGTPLQVVQIPQQQKRTPLTIASTRLRIPSGSKRISTQPSTPPIMEEGAFFFPDPNRVPKDAAIYGTLPKHPIVTQPGHPGSKRLQPRKLDLVHQQPVLSVHPDSIQRHPSMQRYYGNPDMQVVPANMYSSLRTRGVHANKMMHHHHPPAMLPTNTYTVPANNHHTKFTSLPRSHRIVTTASSGGGYSTQLDEGGFERPSTLNRKRHVPAALMRQMSVPVTTQPIYVPQPTYVPSQKPVYVPPPQVPSSPEKT